MRSAPPNRGLFPSDHQPLPGLGVGCDVIPWRWPEFENMLADPSHHQRCAWASARKVRQQARGHRPGSAEVELRTCGRFALTTSPRRRIIPGPEPGIRRKSRYTSQMRPFMAARPGTMRPPPAGINAGGVRHRLLYVSRLTCNAVGSNRNSLGVSSLGRYPEGLLRQRRDAEDPRPSGSPPQCTTRHGSDVYYLLRDSMSSHKALGARALLRPPACRLVRYLTRGDAHSRVELNRSAVATL